LKAWLQGKTPATSVAFAARAALRVLPIKWEVRGLAFEDEFVADIVLPVFRATGVPWATAKYPARATMLKSAAARAASTAHAAASHAASHAVAYAASARAAAHAADAAHAATAAAAAHAAYPSFGLNLHRAAAPLWTAVSIDATRVEEGVVASVIAGSPLWPEGQPGQLPFLWHEMKAALLAAKQDWEVWTLWYDDRLEGRVRDEERELAYVRIEDTLWNQGPAIVNAEIRRMIEDFEAPQSDTQEPKRSPAGLSMLDGFSIPGQSHTQEPKPSAIPEIPPQRPAALEPVWSNGKLVLPARSARTDGDKRANAAALKALRAEINDLADDADSEANIDKRAVAYFRRVARRISDRPPSQDELFRLAHAKEFLEAYAKTVSDEWPEFLARRFHALTLHFDRTVRQFPKWREFVRNAETDRLTPAQAAEVPSLANAFVEALRDEDAREFINPSVPTALQMLQAPLQPAGESDMDRPPLANEQIRPGLAEDVVESINNIAKRAVEAALASNAVDERTAKSKAAVKTKTGGLRGTAKELASGYAVEARKSLVKESKRLGKETGPAVTKWAKRTILAGGAIPVLMRISPAAFHWLEAIKPFLHFH
jgi:hypothetical protein